MKKQLGKQIKSLRQERGVSTTQLEKKGIHPRIPKAIESGQGYTMDTLEKYLEAISPGEFELCVGEKKKEPET